MVALALPAAAQANVGYEGPRYEPPGQLSPTSEKPQSKLWYHDGSWWGSLFVPGDPSTAQEYRIHRLDPQTHSWVDTGTRIDERNSSEADVLWDGTHLYVASASDAAGVPEIRLYRLSYNGSTQTYGVDSGFPVTVGTAGPVEAVVLAKDTTGRLWMTYTREDPTDRNVYVARSDSSDAAWNAPFPLPLAQAQNIDPDDISSIVSFEDKVGVMWSNQTDDKIYFATHADGASDSAWTPAQAAFDGPFSSDDHVNLKSLQNDPAGRVFAVVKTSLGDAPMPSAGDPQVVVLVLGADGSWSNYTFGTVGDDHTRPILLTDQRTRKLYVFATSPTFADQGNQAIYYKETSLDNPCFAPGVGQPFLQSSAGNDINDATSTKQDLGNAPGLAVLASDDADYWHNMLDLNGSSAQLSACPGAGGGGGPSQPSQPSQPTPADRTRPVISGVSVRPFAFRARRGTRVRFTLSERARVSFRVERRVRRRARRFRYVRLRGGFSVVRRRGRHAVRFSGRLRRRALRRGRYRLVLVAVDSAGNRSSPKRAGFRIRR